MEPAEEVAPVAEGTWRYVGVGEHDATFHRQMDTSYIATNVKAPINDANSICSRSSISCNAFSRHSQIE